MRFEDFFTGKLVVDGEVFQVFFYALVGLLALLDFLKGQSFEFVFV